MNKEEQDIVNRVIERYEAMRSFRSVFERHWEDVADVITPRDRNFTSFFSPGEKKRQNQYDSVTEFSLNRATSFYDSVTTPRDKRWHGLTASDQELKKNQRVREYYDTVEDILFQHRYGPRSNYASARHEQIRSMFAFGQGALFVDMVGNKIRYLPVHISQLFFDEDAYGIIDTCYRIIDMTKKQIEQRFGEDALPNSLKNQTKADSQITYKVIHCCEPNYNYVQGSLNPEERKYISYYVLYSQERKLLDTTGYDNFPYAISRDQRSPREVYARGIAMGVLPNVQMVNQMKKTHIEAGHMSIRPTLLMKDDGSINSVDLRPGKIVRGGIDASGQRALEPLNHGVRYDISVDMLEREHNMIREAFMLDLFISNLEREATATEVLTRSQEQARLLAPMSGQEETESHPVLIERELNLHEIAGNIPPMPEELVEVMGDFQIEYTSPLANSQKSDEALGATQTVQSIFASAQFDPSALDIVDFDEYHRLIAEANGTPAKILNSEEEIAAVREQRAQQEQQMMMAQNAKPVADAALSAARAEKTAAEI